MGEDIGNQIDELNAHWCRYGYDTIAFHKFASGLAARLSAAEAQGEAMRGALVEALIVLAEDDRPSGSIRPAKAIISRALEGAKGI